METTTMSISVVLFASRFFFFSRFSRSNAASETGIACGDCGAAEVAEGVDAPLPPPAAGATAAPSTAGEGGAEVGAKVDGDGTGGYVNVARCGA